MSQLLTGQLPVSVFARIQGLELSVVDCGVAEMAGAARSLLIRRKIAHGTRNARVGQAMSVDHAHAAIRAGMEIGDTLRGNLVAWPASASARTKARRWCCRASPTRPCAT